MVAALAVVAAALAACSSGSAPTAAVSVDPSAPRVVARDLQFSTPVVSAPADRPFELVFDNQESALHNVAIQAPGGSDLFTGELFSGPAVRVYSVPALAAGSYRFICSVHPEMVGELTVR
jgi:plastocyanin